MGDKGPKDKKNKKPKSNKNVDPSKLPPHLQPKTPKTPK